MNASVPVYDPKKSFQENFDQGPFGEFADPQSCYNAGEPRYEFFGNEVYLPFGIAAGPLPNSRFVRAAFAMGFDINVYKTVRSRARPSNPWPNILPVETGNLRPGGSAKTIADYVGRFSVTNSFGVPSMDPDFWQKDMAAAVAMAGKGQVLVGSFQGTWRQGQSGEDYIADFALAARLVKETGVKVVEVNLSCPNEGRSEMLCLDAERAAQAVAAVKNEIGDLPLIIKIGYFPDGDGFGKLMALVGRAVQGVAAINTIFAKVVNERGGNALGPDRPISGIGGPAIKWAGLEMTARLKKIREENGYKYKIIGIGGVASGADYQEYAAAGADAVMCASAMMWNPLLAQEIKQELRA